MKHIFPVNERISLVSEDYHLMGLKNTWMAVMAQPNQIQRENRKQKLKENYTGCLKKNATLGFCAVFA